MRAGGKSIGVALLALGLGPGPSAGAFAASPEPASITPKREGEAIIGGSASEPCEWPTVVALRTGGLCTGTLVHPRIVAYAAHCGTLHSRVLFGEDVDAPGREVPTLRCERYTDLFAVSSMDFAYCELAEPVEDVAITPLLFGCDEALIEVGTPVTIVGFGETTTEGPPQVGIKHAAPTQIIGTLTMVTIGGMGTGADSGDSGGPALVELDDGSWWVLGIASGGGGEGAAVQYVPAPNLVAWIEDRTGIDVTPCHAGDGSWAPTPGCGGLFAGTEADASWAAGCPGPVSPPSQRCGPAWTSLEDSEAPSVRFVEPVDQAVFEAAPVELDVLAEAEDAGVGVRELRLLVDGEPWLDRFGREGFDQVPPYRFEAVRFEVEGPHTLTLVAVDHFDNVGTVSATIFVGELAGDTGDDETETDTGGAPASPAEPGCACASGPARPGSIGLTLALLSVFWAWGPRCRRSPRAAFHRRR